MLIHSFPQCNMQAFWTMSCCLVVFCHKDTNDLLSKIAAQTQNDCLPMQPTPASGFHCVESLMSGWPTTKPTWEVELHPIQVLRGRSAIGGSQANFLLQHRGHTALLFFTAERERLCFLLLLSNQLLKRTAFLSLPTQSFSLCHWEMANCLTHLMALLTQCFHCAIGRWPTAGTTWWDCISFKCFGEHINGICCCSWDELATTGPFCFHALNTGDIFCCLVEGQCSVHLGHSWLRSNGSLSNSQAHSLPQHGWQATWKLLLAHLLLLREKMSLGSIGISWFACNWDELATTSSY